MEIVRRDYEGENGIITMSKKRERNGTSHPRRCLADYWD